MILEKIRINRLKKDINNDRDFIGIPLNNSSDITYLQEDELEMGDILFFASGVVEKRDMISLLIESFTAGYYIHCAIYVGNGNIVEAQKDGVNEKKLNERREKYAYLCVVRMKVSMDAKSRMVSIARSFIGYKYNLYGAICAPKNEEKHILRANSSITKMFSTVDKIKKNKRLFCSQLIMECIRESGALCDEELGLDYFQSQNWTPTGLAKYGFPDFFEFVGYLIHNIDHFNDKDYFLSNSMDPSFHNHRR